MKVSIIVPVYNVENYVEECFQSIARQTYAGPMECIFVDDCGTDRSVALVEEMIAAYRGPIAFKMVHHERNKGLSAARNTGLREASGDYVYFIDSDDSITPECIALLSALAKKYPGVDMVQGNLETDLSCLRINKDLRTEYNENQLWIKEKILSRQLPMTAWNRLVRRDFLLMNCLFFEEGLIHEDELWTFLLAKKLQSVALCMEYTYLNRTNPNGITSSAKQNRFSAAPVVRVMARNLGKPLLFLEMKYMMVLVPEEFCQDEVFLKNLGKYKHFVLKWNHMLQEMCSTKKWSMRGLWVRILYNILPFFYKRDILI